MADGFPEPLPDRKFLSYIWNFEKRYAPLFIEQIDQHGPDVPVAVIRTHREMDTLLSLLISLPDLCHSKSPGNCTGRSMPPSIDKFKAPINQVYNITKTG